MSALGHRGVDRRCRRGPPHRHRHHLSHFDQTVVVLAANVISFGIFWVLKFMVFNRLFHVHPLEELDELVEAA